METGLYSPRVYAVVLTASTPHDAEVMRRLREAYPRHHLIADNLILVASEDIAELVAQKVGIKGESRIEGVTGAVFKLNGAYAGFASRALWEWLTDVVPQI